MADNPESSRRNDVEEASRTEENITLVDTVDDPTLDWVGAEPRGIVSMYKHRNR